MENFDKIEETGAIVDDLPKTKSVTFKAANWIAINDGALYQYTLEDEIIKIKSNKPKTTPKKPNKNAI